MCTTFLPPFAILETQEEGQDTLLLQGRNFSVYNLEPMHSLEHPPPSTQQSDWFAGDLDAPIKWKFHHLPTSWSICSWEARIQVLGLRVWLTHGVVVLRPSVLKEWLVGVFLPPRGFLKELHVQQVIRRLRRRKECAFVWMCANGRHEDSTICLWTRRASVMFWWIAKTSGYTRGHGDRERASGERQSFARYQGVMELTANAKQRLHK
jgi:hypothetical protein